MKGLVIKDLMCLRKQRTVFYLTVIETLIVSVMFAQSYKHGNIHKAAEAMISFGPEGSWIVNFGAVSILFLLLQFSNMTEKQDLPRSAPRCRFQQKNGYCQDIFRLFQCWESV